MTCATHLVSIGVHFVASWPHFYQTRSAWSVDQGSNKNHSPAYNFAPTVTKFCVMWEGLSLPHDTKFGNCWCKIVDSRAFPSWSLIHGLRWSGLIKAEPVKIQCNGLIRNNTFRHLFLYPERYRTPNICDHTVYCFTILDSYGKRYFIFFYYFVKQ